MSRPILRAFFPSDSIRPGSLRSPLTPPAMASGSRNGIRIPLPSPRSSFACQ